MTTKSNAASRWLSCPRRNPEARLKLFCFPYAGGSALIYRSWPALLPPVAEVYTVNLPGRGMRVQEQPFTRLEPLISQTAEALLPHLDKPFVFFGHSMGALISFELAHHLRREHGLSPSLLLVSGRRAPQSEYDEPPVHDLPEPEFIQELRRLNGTPTEVLEHPELLKLVIPLLRADFSVCETYTYASRPPLDCPITAYGGLEDADVSREQLEAWREQTTSDFRLRMLPGDHFFINSSQALLLESITLELGVLLRRLPAGHAPAR